MNQNNREIFSRHITIKYPEKYHGDDLGLVYGFEPPTNASTELGNIFLIFDGQVENASGLGSELLKLAAKEFYEPGIQISFNVRFERLLKAFNTILSKTDTNHIHAAVLATRHQWAQFSSIGSPLMYLYRKEKLTKLLVEDEVTHTFSGVNSFQLKPEDRIILGSHAISVQMTETELTKLLSDSPIEHFAKNLKSYLDITQAKLVFTAILVELDVNPVKTIAQPEESFVHQDEPKTSRLQQVSKHIKQSSTNIAKTVNRSGKKTKNKVVPGVASKTKQGWTSLWSRYINPYPKRAIIVVIVTIIIIIGIGVGLSAFWGNQNSLSYKLNQTTLLLDQAQKSIASNDNPAAKNALTKASQLLASMNQQEKNKTTTNVETLNKAQTRYQQLSDQLTDTTRIITNESFTIPNRSLSSLIFMTNSLYGIDTKTGEVIEINPIRKTLPVLAQSESLKQLTNASPSYSGDSMVILANNKVFQYSRTNALQELKVSNLPTSVAIASYLENLYLLSPLSNQVVRYVKSGTNLTNRAEILKNLSTDTLKNSTSFVVSGNIFISSGSQILLFENGSQRDFNISGLPESFGNIAQVQVQQKPGTFLVLNQTRTRIALLTTQASGAEFKRQYAIGSDEKIESYTTTPDGNEVFVFAGGKIVTFTTE